MSAPPRMKLTGFTAAMMMVGVVLTGHYGMAWYELPKYSEDDIAISAMLNVQMDLQRQNLRIPPPAAEVERLRLQVRNEIEADIAKAEREIHTGFAVGLVALILGIGQAILSRRLQRSTA
jgi:hypothetical protein